MSITGGATAGLGSHTHKNSPDGAYYRAVVTPRWGYKTRNGVTPGYTGGYRYYAPLVRKCNITIAALMF